ncbi:MAG: hypothetical protein QNJ31_09175 [Candidatus Caenarcaniphilales bacterium]|nr:hypothetical protein [Candidatus Caenarcaniphilales bacterium]
MSAKAIVFSSFSRIRGLLNPTWHGTNTANIEKLYSGNKVPDSNADQLYGPGVYTANRKSAENYAILRTNSLGGTPTVYEFDVSGQNFFDLSLVDKAFHRFRKSGVNDPMVRDLLSLIDSYIGFIQGEISNTQTGTSPAALIKKNQQNYLLELSSGLKKGIEKGTLDESYNINNWLSSTFTGFSVYSHGMAKTYLNRLIQSVGSYNGLIGVERPDWNSGKGRSLTYVLFENEGLTPKSSYTVAQK